MSYNEDMEDQNNIEESHPQDIYYSPSQNYDQFDKADSYTRSRSHSRSNSPDMDIVYEKTNRSDRHRSEKRRGRRRSRSNKGSRRVYVSNISFEADYDEIKSEFDKVGEVTHVQLLKDDSGRFKGCAVVTFRENHMAQEAMDTLNRAEFRGRKLVVREEEANPDFRARNKPPPSDKPMANPGDANTYGLSTGFLSSLNIDLPLVNIIFVANLDFNVTTDNLKEVFRLAGNVQYSEVFTDKDGNSRGFGIVEFEHPVEAVQAISMLHNQAYRDRPLSVRMDRSDRTNESRQRLPVGLKAVGMGLGVNGKPLKNIKSLTMNQLNDSLSTCNPMMAAAASTAMMNPMAGVGHMGGMNGGAASLTGQMGPTVMGYPNMAAMANMNAMGAAGVNMNQGLMGPMPNMTAAMGQPMGMGQPMMGMMGGANMGGGGGNNMNNNNSNNSSHQSRKSSSSTSSSSKPARNRNKLGNIIEVGNLPFSCDTEGLKSICWSAGAEMRLAEIRSPGVGIVKFRNEFDAQKCLEALQRQPYEGRMLTVKII